MHPDPSIIRDLGLEAPVIQVVNMRAEARPFVILEPGSRPLVYVGRVRPKLVNFPAYNHWPVCQVYSDGRFAQAADRASSFSISYHTPPRHEAPGGRLWAALFYGATFGEPSDLVNLARSWIRPPELRVLAGPVGTPVYDRSRRAYVLDCAARGGAEGLDLEFSADPSSPLVNACLELKGWGEEEPKVRMDGRLLGKNTGYRIGRIRTLEGTDLVLWLEAEASGPFRLSLEHRR
jgi:hypothetical protein